MRRVSNWNWLWLLSLLALNACDSDSGSSNNSTAAGPKTVPLTAAEISQRFSGLKFDVLDISEQNYQNRSSLALVLSAPLDAKTDYQPHLQVLDNSGQRVAGAWVLAENGLSLYFQNIEPEQKYKVLVAGKLTDALGRSLDKDLNQEIETRALPSTATFATRGTILPGKLGKGLPVDSVNVAEVDIDFHRVSPNKIPQFLAQYGNAGERSTWSLTKNNWDSESQLAEFFNLSYSGRFSLKSEKNTRIRNFLPLADIKELRQPGLYLAIMKGAGSYPDQYQTTPFVISDLGVHAHLYEQQTELVLSSLESGSAIKGVQVSQLDNNGKVLNESQTDSDGLANLQRHKDAVLILAQKDNDIALIDLNAPSLDLSEFKQGERAAQAQEIFIYGPRDIYRPGETAKLGLLLRDPDAQYQASPPLQVSVELPDGTRQELGVIQGDNLGYYHYEYPVAADATLGSWKFHASIAGTSIQHVYPFRVEQFLPERLSLSLTPSADVPLVQNKDAPLQLDIEGRYLYGAVADNNRFSTRITVNTDRQPLDSLPGFEFGDLQETTSQEFDTIEDQLDTSGKFSLNSSSQWSEIKSPVRLKAEVSLFDDGGRPITRVFEQRVWPDDTSIGIRPASFKPDQRVPARSNVEFEVVKANRAGELLGANIEVKLIQEAKNPYWSYTSDGGWQLEFNEKEYPVLQQSLALPAGSKTKLALPVDWGQYRVELLDPVTGKITSSRFIAGEDWWYDQKQNSEQAAPRPDQVQIQLNQTSYKEGDSATVKLTAPFDAEALVSVEADKLLWSKRVALSKSGTEISIPIGQDWHRHDLYVTVVALKAGETGSKPGPNRAFGLLHLPLERGERKLALSIEAATQTEPNQPFQVKLKLAQPVAAGQEVAVTLAAVDAGVLSLTHFATPDAFKWFFAPRRYSPEIKDLYHKLIDNGDGTWAKLRFGGDAALDMSGKQPDEEVEILSIFKGPVRFNAQGEAVLSLDLPDFNGKMRLMALAFSKNQYGTAEQEVTIAAPIIAELSQPRFIAGGDQSQLTLAVQNLTTNDQELQVELTATHPLKLQADPQQLQLKPQQKRVLQFPIGAAITLGKGDIDLNIRGIKLPGQSSSTSLSRHWSLGVRPAWPAQTRSKFVALKQGEQVELSADMLSALARTSLQGRLSIQTTPPLNLAKNLHELLHYPYGCLEQTSSAAYPLALASPERMASLGLTSEAVTAEERSKRIQVAISRISGMQKSNGSYGLWDNNSDEEHWLTAYVADFLLNTRDAGFEVPTNLLERNLKRLEDYLRTEGSQPEERWSNNPDHYRLSYRAYAGYVLSRVKRARLGDLRTLYDNSAQYDRSGLPLTQLGLALIRMGDNQRGEQALQKAAVLAEQEGDRYRWFGDYGSPIRDESMMLALLAIEQKLPSNFAPRLLKLSEKIRNDNYLSTQERNSLFVLGASLPLAKNANWQANLSLVDGSNESLTGGSLNQRLLPEQLKTGLKLKNISEQMLFAQLDVNGYPEQAVTETSHRDLNLERRFYNTRGEPLTSNKVAAGDLVVVEVRLANQWQRLPDLMLVELLASGFELENQNMDNSIKLDKIQIDGKNIADIQSENPVKHQEYRSDRYIATFDLDSGERMQRSFYLMRAVTPGTYQLPNSKVEDMYHPQVFAVTPGQFGGKLIITAKTKTTDNGSTAAAATRVATPTVSTSLALVPAAVVASSPAAAPALDEDEEDAVETAAPTAVAPIELPGLAQSGLLLEQQRPLAALLNAAANQDTDQQQQLKTELDALPKSPRGNRKEARKLNELALEQFKLTDYKAAIGLFEQAVAADAADVEILNNLGYAQLKDQQLKQAEATLWQTLSKQSGRAGAWANLAEVFALKGEQAAAIAAWRNTLFFSGNPDKTRQVLTNQRDDANTPAAVKTSLQAVLGSGQ